ncbi:hypothetical protein BDAP_000730 [Binucleata daphniae]
MTSKIYKFCVVGSGPAAYTALQYLKEYDVIHFEGSIVGNNGPGGQLTTTTNVDNYPGFPNGIQGPELIEKMQEQYKGIVISENVVNISIVHKETHGNNGEITNEKKDEKIDESNDNADYKNNVYDNNTHEDEVKQNMNEETDSCKKENENDKTGSNDNIKDDIELDLNAINEPTCVKKHKKNTMMRVFEIKTEENNIFHAYCVLICTGAEAKRLFVPGTNDGEFWQKGVSSCAVCDGWIYRDKKVIVIGGGDSAMEEALYLSNIASEVILIHRSYDFKARKDMLQRVKANKKIKIQIPYVLECVRGDKHMDSAYFRNVDTKEMLKIDAEGLFFGIGHTPNTSFLDKNFAKDADGYLITDKNGKTTVDGVFACGDVQDKKYKQAVTAAGSGCLAAMNAIKYIKNMQ